jgi:hypothetical protein
MARFTIRYRQDGEGWWYEVRDHRRKLRARAWRAGGKSAARDEARRARDRLMHGEKEAA